MIALEEAALAPVARVGGKASMLGQALRRGFKVPLGTVVESCDDPRMEAVLGALPYVGPYAVRSSAPQEDGHRRSWAGQFESRVPVDVHDLTGAITAVRGSGESSRARAYDGTDSAVEPIPVLVQPVVRAIAAGVAFSLDPATATRARASSRPSTDWPRA